MSWGSDGSWQGVSESVSGVDSDRMGLFIILGSSWSGWVYVYGVYVGRIKVS